MAWAVLAVVTAFTVLLWLRGRARIAALTDRLAELQGIVEVKESDLAELRQEAERERNIRKFGKVGTWDWVIETDELHWSDEVYALFGLNPAETRTSYSLFCDMVHPEDAQRVRYGEIGCVADGQGHDEEYRIIRLDGSVRWLRETGNVLVDASGKPVRMLGVVRDITDEKAREHAILRHAFYDPVTELPNRTHFRSRLHEVVSDAIRAGTMAALVMIELRDGDRRANDTVLKAFAARLASLAGQDAVARFDTDLFVAVFDRQSSTQEAVTRCSTLVEALSWPFEAGGEQHTPRLSAGACVFPTLADSVEALTHSADIALGRARNLGPNGFQVFPPFGG